MVEEPLPQIMYLENELMKRRPKGILWYARISISFLMGIVAVFFISIWVYSLYDGANDYSITLMAINSFIACYLTKMIFPQNLTSEHLIKAPLHNSNLMKCHLCGKGIKPEWKRCANCGSRLV